MPRIPSLLCALALCGGIVACTTACTTVEFVHGALQTLYNSGKYLCKQSPGRCDVPQDHNAPGAATNRR